MLAATHGWGKQETGKFGMARYAARMKLYYAHDPMCSWCWAFRPVWHQLRQALQARLGDMRIVNLLGGLAADSDEPMSAHLQQEIRGHWQRIQRVAPETQFNFDFWKTCTPRRSTYPACRAVIAAGMQQPGGNSASLEEDMILAIQQAYYMHARNPSDDAVLTQLAGELGLDMKHFIHDLHAQATHRRLAEEMNLARRIGAQGFPCLIVAAHDSYHPVSVDYRNAAPMLERILHL